MSSGSISGSDRDYEISVVPGLPSAQVLGGTVIGCGGKPCTCNAAVSGVFGCEVALDEMRAQRLPLFAGQINRWIVMTSVLPGLSPDKQSELVTRDIEQLFIGHQGDPVEGGGLLERQFPIHPTKIKRLSIGPVFTIGKPPTIEAAEKGQMQGFLKLNPHGAKLYRNTLFTPVSFVYAPELNDKGSRGTNWVWNRANKLFAECADGGYGLAAVLEPVALSPEELKAVEKEPSGLFGEIGVQLSGATKVLLFGGAAILLFHLFNATKPRVKA